MYIVISGNTGAGKSTLGHNISIELKNDLSLEYIDEKIFHHELIQQMFDCPLKYAFLVQMNFLLQRTLKIKYLTENNINFLMERSLNEDFLFAYRHYQLKNISSDEFASYKKFWNSCLNIVPSPSLFICLHSPNSNFLTQRLIKGYKEGTRIRELPDDKLHEYVSQMNKLYNEWFKKLNEEKIEISISESSLVETIDFAKITKSILNEAKIERCI